MKFIEIRGAREHNLRNLQLSIPRDKLIVITGLSGSGKSTLAFDTIYAEGQRRYVESLSAYARQFLELMEKPQIDSIEGLSPAIAIEQKTTSRNPRSTVGTVTEIYDYLRLLFARIGIPYSPATGLPISSQTVTEMVDKVYQLPMNHKLLILSPVVRGRKGEFKKEIQTLLKKGYQRIRIDGAVYEIDDLPKIDKKKKHDIEVVIDRIISNKKHDNRLADSFETALEVGDGIVFVDDLDSNETHVFSAKHACPVSGFVIEEIEPRLFSFNNPYGACPACDGLGYKQSFDKDLVIPNQNLSLNENAIAPWAKTSSKLYQQTIDGIAKSLNISKNKPWKELNEKIQDLILFGTKDIVKINYKYDGYDYTVKKTI